MNNHIENKENQWNNIEKKNSNWFREKRESIKNFLEWKKDAEEIQVEEETSRKTENLKDSAIDSTLDNLNLDMQEWLELKDTDDETKKELNQFFEKWKEKFKDDVQTPEGQELSQKLLQSDRFKNRSTETVQQIAKSATKIENEIKDWQKEKNPVAKSLLKFADWIMSTEKQ